MAFSSTVTAVLTAALLVAAIGVTEGQNDCAAQLAVCADSLNSTTPSEECCNTIKKVVATQLNCLCNLLKTPGLLPDPQQALQLPRRCNLPSDTSACNADAPSGSSLPPPATGGGQSNAAVTLPWMGMPALLFLLALTSLQ